jgi:hypothetical protein
VGPQVRLLEHGRESGNPGGRPRDLAGVRELLRFHAPGAIEELARLAIKARNEATRIAAIRELLDRGYGKPGSGSGSDSQATLEIPIVTAATEITAAR